MTIISEIMKLPTRVEPISGQRFSYVKLDDVLAIFGVDARDHAPAAPDPWVDTRQVRFDDTIVFGHGGFDFERWESFRWEMHTRHGSFAVWKSGSKTWSMYGGKYGVLALDKYSSEAEAREDAVSYLLSLDNEAPPVRSAAIAAGPVAYASAEQLPEIIDKDDKGGVYIPLRKTPAGLFQTPLYAAPTTSPEPTPFLCPKCGARGETDGTATTVREASPEPDAVRDSAVARGNWPQTDADLADEIHRVAGCQVGSIRTQNIIRWFRGKVAALSRPAHGGWEDIKPNMVSQIGTNVSVEFLMPDSSAATALRMRLAFGIQDEVVSLRIPLARNQGQGGGPRS